MNNGDNICNRFAKLNGIQMKQLLKKHPSHLFYIALIMYVILGYTPILNSGLFFILVVLTSSAAIMSDFGSKTYQHNSTLVGCICLYLSICVVYKVLGISTFSYGLLILHVLFFMSILLMLIIPSKLSAEKWTLIVKIVLLIICINIIDNIRLCLLYPEIADVVNRGLIDEEIAGERINIGGSKWYNAVFFFFTVSFFAYLNCKNKTFKYLMLGCSGLAALFIFGFCLKASVIVFTFFSAIVLYFAKRSNGKTYFWILASLAGVALLLINLFSDEIIAFLSSSVSSERLASRLISLLDTESMEAEAGVGTMSARGALWMVSIDTWTDNVANFIFGIGAHHDNRDLGITNQSVGIGNHSDFFDTPAKYGIIGLILIFNILRLGFKRILSIYEKKYHLQLYVIFALFVLFGFTKGVFTPGIGCAIFLFLPLVKSAIDRNSLVK